MRCTGSPLPTTPRKGVFTLLVWLFAFVLVSGAHAVTYNLTYVDPAVPEDPMQGVAQRSFSVTLSDDPVDAYQAILCETMTPGMSPNARNFITAARVASFHSNETSWFPRTSAGVEAMLDVVVAATGRNDLRDLPLFFTGNSTGGILSCVSGGRGWPKTAAVVAASHANTTTGRATPPESAPPLLLTHGAFEVDPSITFTLFGDRATYNSKIGYHISWDSGHELFGAENQQEFPYLYMTENLRLRQQLGHTALRGDNGRLSMPPVPVTSGWLVRGSYFGKDNLGNYGLLRASWPAISSEPTYTATAKKDAFWLPTEAAARAYQAMQAAPSFSSVSGQGHFSMKTGLPPYYSVHVGETLTVAPWFNPSHSAAMGTITSVECWLGGRLYATRNAPDANGRWTFTYRPANCDVQPIIFVANTSTGAKVGTFRLLNVLPARGRGGLSREYWTGIAGDTVASLTSSPAFIANTPTGQDQLFNPETFGWSGSDNPVSTTNYADNYGQRVRGYIDVKAGTLTFYLAASNSAELWLNPEGEDPAGKILVAREDTGRSYRSWPDSGTARSVQFNFPTARRCYIEILHKGGTGNDHCAVAWDGSAAGPGINVNGKSIPRLENLHPFRVFDASVSLSVSGSTGQVSIPRVFDEDFRLALTSSNPAAVSVPATVVIPAGQTSATFAVTTTSLASPVTLSAYAYGWPEARFVLSPTPAPKIELSGRGVVIASGDTTPSTTDHTDFGQTLVADASLTRVFAVRNTGSASLSLTGLSVTGAASADFAVLDSIPASLAPGASSTFRVRFDPNAAGARNATVVISSNDPANASATFAITGTAVNNVGSPEINVTGNGLNIASGDTTPSTSDNTDLGVTNISNGQIFKTFVIQNTGPATLNISSVTISGANASDFAVTHAALPSLPTGNINFTVRFDPSATGVRAATVTIANNDPDEASYMFAIRGTGTSGPEIAVTGNGANIPHNDTTPGTGDNTDLGTNSSNYPAAERTFTIANSGSDPLDLGTVTVTTLTGSGGFSVTQPLVSSVPAGGSTTFKVRYSAIANEVPTATVEIPNNDADEAPFRFRVRGTGQTPEIECAGTPDATNYLEANKAPTAAYNNFGSIAAAGTASVTKGYTIWNSTSVAVLTIRGLSVVGPNASEFTVTPAASLPLQMGVLAPTTFNVKFDPAGTGTRRATIVIDNSDPNESPFTFEVQGVGTGADNTSSFAFSTSPLTGYEEAPKVSVTVRRVGSTIGAVSVYYTLADGTAFAGSDFEHVSGQLTWADGDGGERTIDIPLIDDDTAEGVETFTFRLYDAVGASLPSPASLTITLREQETNAAPVVVIDSPAAPAHALVGRPLRIHATTTDDGYRAPLGFTWSLVSGPDGGSVAFENPATEDCSAIFNLPGDYLLRLTANDSHLSGSADIAVKVSAAPRLALHLRLDESSGFNAPDTSGNGLHGALNGVPFWQPANGKVAGSLVFNRVNANNDYIRVPDSDLLDDTPGLTLSLWIRPDNLYSEDRGLIAKHTYTGGGSFEISYRMYFSSVIKVDIGRSGSNNVDVLSSDTGLVPAGSWTHVAYVFDGTQASSSRSRIYINGVLNKTGAASITSLPNQPSQLYVGTWDQNASSGGGRRFIGQIDDLRIYRAALSATEIAALANLSPSLSLSRGGAAFANGAIDTFATPVTLGLPATINYQLANPGFGTLTLSGPVSVANAVNCTATVVTAPATNLAPGATTIIGVRITPTASGIWSVDLSVPSNDPANASSSWSLGGTARTAYSAWTDGISWGALDRTALADPDADGVPNLLEYALGRDPLLPAAAPATTVTVTAAPALAIAFTRIADPALTYTVEATNSLGADANWTPIWSSSGVANVAGPVTVTDTVSLNTQARRFLRLRVTGN